MIVDIVDDSPFIRAALAIALPAATAGTGTELRVSAASWTEYSQSWARLSDVTVFRAELIDHVPAALKVRALAALDVAPVALLNAPAPRHEARLYQAGAVGVVYASDALTTLIERITDPAPRPKESSPPSTIVLSDRELQIACLYCGRSAPSASSLGRTLRLQEQTVRRHLARAREQYKSLGIDVATRMKLRAALIEDGWLLPTL